MDVCIKGVNEEDWRAFKAEAAKKGLKTGELFSKLVREKNSNWDQILDGKKLGKEIVDKEIFNDIRKEFREQFFARQHK